MKTAPWGFRLAGAVLLIFGLLPIANWIPGGHEYPAFGDALDRWLSGGGIALGLGVIAAIAFHRYPGLWRQGLWQRLGRRWQGAGVWADVGLALLVTALCALISQIIFSARPLLIDEIIQVYQARIFASGRLWLPAPEHPEFTSAMHLIDWGGKVYGQFPAGGPAVLMLGTLAHAEWLVGPVCAGLSLFFFARLLRRIELRPGVALAALLLFAFCPFVLFLGGSYMNHVFTLTALLAAALALSHATAGERAHPAWALGCGLALGLAASIRPTDGLAFALPVAAWLLWRARRGGRPLGALLLSGVGVAIPLALLLWVNANQTGNPFRFGYIEMWGKTHALGFHEAPWGPPHTPLRGLELVNLYLLRLQVYLFESAGPGLLFASLALLLARRVTAFDRWVLAATALLLGGYFAYWHDGFYLGPRFVYPLAPWLLLWTARLPAVLAERGLGLSLRQGLLSGGLVALGLGGVVYLPYRAEQYRNGMLYGRIDVDKLTSELGIHDAVIIVRESWGSQLMTRLWALGVSRPMSEAIYRSTDSCALDQLLGSVERSGGGNAELLRGVADLRADSASLVKLKASPDTTLSFMQGSALTQRCQQRLIEDQAGFTPFAPFILVGGSNRYVTDLHGADSVIIAASRGKPVWLLTRPPRVGADPVLSRVSVDSLLADWKSGQ